jgi:hypothetical protein
MIDFLMGQAAVVLENVVIFGARRFGNLLRHRQYLSQLVVRNIRQLRTVMLRDDKLR